MNIPQDYGLVTSDSWYLVHVHDGETLSDAIKANSMKSNDIEPNSRRWLKNAFSYVGGTTNLTITSGQGMRAEGTSSYTWEEFANRINQFPLQSYNDWNCDDTFKQGLFDVTPYYDEYKINNKSWPCWVQLSSDQVDIDTISYTGGANSVDVNHDDNNQFQSPGWYCIAVNSGQNVESVFFNSILEDSTDGKWKLHVMYKAKDNDPSPFHGTVNLMDSQRGNHESYFDSYNSLTEPQSQNTVIWINVSNTDTA